MQMGKNNQVGNWTLVITTQHMENYAAHNGDYEPGISEDQWKYKGGDVYYVTDITDGQRERIEAGGIPTLKSLIESNSDGFREYILGWEFVEPGTKISESWEIPIEFYWDTGDLTWRCSTHHTPGDESFWNPAVLCRAEQWKPVAGGGRTEYECQIKTANGWFDEADPKLKDQLAA